MTETTPPIELVRHPATPAAVVRALTVQPHSSDDGALHIAYRLWGDIARLRIPDQQPPGQADELWQHTCFEAFLGDPATPAYREFNFSPSGLWACYDFADYRHRDATPREIAAPTIVTRRYAGRLEVDATIPPSALPAATTLSIGLCAVIEAADIVDGSHSYWALAHCAERPDFHRHESFTLKLARA